MNANAKSKASTVKFGKTFVTIPAGVGAEFDALVANGAPARRTSRQKLVTV